MVFNFVRIFPHVNLLCSGTVNPLSII